MTITCTPNSSNEVFQNLWDEGKKYVQTGVEKQASLFVALPK